MPRVPLPGGAVFSPRKLADSPAKFGRTTSRLSVEPLGSPQQEAAEFQHLVANRIREHLLDQRLNLKSFCAGRTLPAGLNYERFQRISRGETMLTLTDLFFWANEVPDLAGFIAIQMRHIIEAEHAQPDHGFARSETD